MSCASALAGSRKARPHQATRWPFSPEAIAGVAGYVADMWRGSAGVAGSDLRR